MKRREFLHKAVVTTTAASASMALSAPAVHAKKTFRWKMVTAWPPHFPVLGEGADLFAKWVGELSDGRLRIQVYGGGELVPPLRHLTR